MTDNGEIDLTGNAVLKDGTLKNNRNVQGQRHRQRVHNEGDHQRRDRNGRSSRQRGALTVDQGSTVASSGNVTVDASGG